MNQPSEIPNQVVSKVTEQQSTVGSTLADVGGTAAELGVEVVAEEAFYGVVETVGGAAADLIGGILDGI